MDPICSSDRISIVDTTTPNTRKSYSVDYKLGVLKKLMENNGNKSLTSRQLGISRSLIQDWEKQEEDYKRIKDDRGLQLRKRRRVVANEEQLKENAKFPEMEKQLVEWFKIEKEKGHEVDCNRWKIKAKSLFIDIYNKNSDQTEFTASNGWLWRFLIRHKITDRAITNIGQSIPENAKEMIENHFRYFDKISCGLSQEKFGNMDETPIYFDMPSNRTFDFKGVKTVRSRTTGYEKMRFTCVLTIMANGKKLKPMIIFKNLKKVPKGDFPNDVIITVCKSGTINKDLMEYYRKEIWQKRPNSLFSGPSVLVLDASTSHKEKSVVSSFKRWSNTSLCVIPGGLTSVVQPLDTYINFPFKCKIRDEWKLWLSEGEEEYTKTGKRKRASYQMVAEWVSSAWRKISEELIVKSFIGCGYCNNRINDDFNSKLRTLINSNECSIDEDHTELTDEDDEDIESSEESDSD